MDKHDSRVGGEALCEVDEKALTSLRECLADGGITPREVGKVLRALGGIGGKCQGEPRCVALAREAGEAIQAGCGDADDLMLQLHRAVFFILRLGGKNSNREAELDAETGRHGTPIWIHSPLGCWGPVGWMRVRKWIYLQLLAPDAVVSVDGGATWQPASAVEKLFRATKGLVDRGGWALGKLATLPPTPVSRGMAARLGALGWPGYIWAIRHYYLANILREDIESAFPDHERPPFDDPDWPEWERRLTPMAAYRAEQEYRNREATERQLAVLEFFLGGGHGIVRFGEADDKISEIFAAEKNETRWKTRNDHKPPTEGQLDRITWWAARLRRKVPENLTFGETRRILTAWAEERREVEDEWNAFQRERETQEMVFHAIADGIIHRCKSLGIYEPGEYTMREGWRRVGGYNGEGLDFFEDRVAAALAGIDPRYKRLLG